LRICLTFLLESTYSFLKAHFAPDMLLFSFLNIFLVHSFNFQKIILALGLLIAYLLIARFSEIYFASVAFWQLLQLQWWKSKYWFVHILLHLIQIISHAIPSTGNQHLTLPKLIKHFKLIFALSKKRNIHSFLRHNVSLNS
jgi:hypothetical protein